MNPKEVARKYLERCVQNIGDTFSYLEYELDSISVPKMERNREKLKIAVKLVKFTQNVTGVPSDELDDLLAKYREFDAKSNELEQGRGEQ